MNVASHRAWLVLAAFLGSASVAVPASQVRDATGARPQGTGSATISGRVTTDEPEPRPIRQATVRLNDGPYSEIAITNDDGRFVFRGLLPGRYTLSASRMPYLSTAYGVRRPPRVSSTTPGIPIALTEGQQFATADMRLSRGATLSGILRDTNGQPALGFPITVAYFQRNPTTGERNVVPYYGASGTSTMTDDRGAFRVYTLPAGEYLLMANPSGFGASSAMNLSPTTDAEVQRARDLLQRPPVPGAAGTPGPTPGATIRRPTVGYVPVFYPGTTDPARALPLTLSTGEERLGLDFQLEFVTTVRVEGIVTGPDGRPTQGAVVRAVRGGSFLNLEMMSGALNGGASDAEGRFVIPGLTPGQYTVQSFAGSGSSTLVAGTDLTVAGDDVSIQLRLYPALTVTGRIVVDAAPGSAKPDFARARIFLNSATQAILAGGGGPATASGEFTIGGITLGRYRISATLPGVANGKDPWFLKSAMIDGRELLDAGVEITRQENLTDLVVTFSDRAAELTGTLSDAAGRPAPDFFVILFGADSRDWSVFSRRILQMRPGSDGRFTFRGLPPGDYRLAAVTDIEQGEWLDPAFLAQLVDASIKLTFAENERKVQDIRIR